MMTYRWSYVLVAMLSTAYFAWFALPLIWSAAENLRLVSVFYSDEATHLYLVKKALNNNTLILDFGSYGHLYFNFILIPLLLLQPFISISEQLIIFILRLVPAVFGAGTAMITFIIARRYVGLYQAWIAFILMSVLPLNFLHMSSISHPDIPQLFFLMLSIYSLCRTAEDDQPKWLVLASANAGLAFACKYSGIFLLPLIYSVLLVKTKKDEKLNKSGFKPGRILNLIRLTVALMGIMGLCCGIFFTQDFVKNYLDIDLNRQTFGINKIDYLNSLRHFSSLLGSALIIISSLNFIWTYVKETPTLFLFIKKSYFVSGIFLLTFIIVSPFSFYKFNILKDILYVSALTSFGHWFETGKDWLLWFKMLKSEQFFDLFFLLVLLFGFLMAVLRLMRKGWQILEEPIMIMWVWVLFFLSYLLLRVHHGAPRYILPVIPVMVILIVFTIDRSIRFLKNYAAVKTIVIPILVIWSTIFFIEIPKSFQQLCGYRSQVMNREANSTSVFVGKWLADNYPNSSRILYDQYSYVPPVFTDALSTFGGTISLLNSYSPDLVIVNQRIANRFSELSKAKKFGWGDKLYVEKYNYYKTLKEGSNEYDLIRDFGEVQVYSRK